MEQKLRVLLAVGVIATATSVNYLIIYMPTYVVKALHLSPVIGYLAAFAVGIAGMLFNPVAGVISDRVGRTPLHDHHGRVAAACDLPGVSCACGQAVRS